MIVVLVVSAGLSIAVDAADAQTPKKPVWTMDISKMVPPDVKVSGSIHGQAFALDNAKLDNGTLTLRQGKDFSPDRSVQVNGLLDNGETVVGRTYRIRSDRGIGRPHVRIQWKREVGKYRVHRIRSSHDCVE